MSDTDIQHWCNSLELSAGRFKVSCFVPILLISQFLFSDPIRKKSNIQDTVNWVNVHGFSSLYQHMELAKLISVGFFAPLAAQPRYTFLAVRTVHTEAEHHIHGNKFFYNKLCQDPLNRYIHTTLSIALHSSLMLIFQSAAGTLSAFPHS